MMRLAKALRAAGYLPWVDHDPGSIPGGSLWREQIVEAIDNADAVLLALSPHAADSDEVRTELDVARELAKPIVPTELQATTLPPTMRYHLAGRQRIDLASDWAAGIKRVLGALGALRKPAADDDEATLEQEIEREGKRMFVAIMDDPDLDMSEKIRRFKSARAADAWRRTMRVLAGERELLSRELHLERTRRATWDRIDELRKELSGLKRKDGQEQKIWDTEQKIREAEKDLAEIESQYQEVSKLRREQLDKDLQELKDSAERRRKFADKTRRDANRLIERIFTPEE